MPGSPISRHVIGPRQHAGGEVDDAGAVGAHIGALVVEEIIVDGEDVPVLVDRGAQLVALLARMIGGDEMLVAVLDPFDRPREPQRREADQHVFRIELAAHAEAAADMAFEQMDGGERPAENLGKLLAIAVRDFRRAMQFEQVAGRVVARNRAAGFQGHCRVPADRDVGLDNGVGTAKGSVEIAVSLLDDHRLSRKPVDLDRLVVSRHHRRQFVELEDDAVGGIFRPIGIVGEHHGDRLADIAHAAARQQRLPVRHELLDPVVAEIDRRQIGEILAGPDRHHARRLTGVGRVDGLDPAVRHRRAHDAHVKLSGERYVGSEQAEPAHQRRVLDARHRGADDTWRLSF